MHGLFVFSRRVCFVCFLINFNFVSVGRAALLHSPLSLVGPDYRASPSAGGGGGGGGVGEGGGFTVVIVCFFSPSPNAVTRGRVSASNC